LSSFGSATEAAENTEGKTISPRRRRDAEEELKKDGRKYGGRRVFLGIDAEEAEGADRATRKYSLRLCASVVNFLACEMAPSRKKRAERVWRSVNIGIHHRGTEAQRTSLRKVNANVVGGPSFLGSAAEEAESAAMKYSLCLCVSVVNFLVCKTAP
jgi:hypothetical protein